LRRVSAPSRSCASIVAIAPDEVVRRLMIVMHAARTFVGTIAGLLALLSIAASTGFRLRGAYWTWRRETAFGSDPTRWPPVRERRRMILEYARWVASMRRMARR